MGNLLKSNLRRKLNYSRIYPMDLEKLTPVVPNACPQLFRDFSNRDFIVCNDACYFTSMNINIKNLNVLASYLKSSHKIYNFSCKVVSHCKFCKVSKNRGFLYVNQLFLNI